MQNIYNHIYIDYMTHIYIYSLVVQLVENGPVMQETLVWYLCWEDSLEKGMATHSSILAWKIPWTEEPGGLQSMGSQRVRHEWAAKPLWDIDNVLEFLKIWSWILLCFQRCYLTSYFYFGQNRRTVKILILNLMEYRITANTVFLFLSFFY